MRKGIVLAICIALAVLTVPPSFAKSDPAFGDLSATRSDKEVKVFDTLNPYTGVRTRSVYVLGWIDGTLTLLSFEHTYYIDKDGNATPSSNEVIGTLSGGVDSGPIDIAPLP